MNQLEGCVAGMDVYDRLSMKTDYCLAFQLHTDLANAMEFKCRMKQFHAHTPLLQFELIRNIVFQSLKTVGFVLPGRGFISLPSDRVGTPEAPRRRERP
jgi:hypothetical protein